MANDNRLNKSGLRYVFSKLKTHLDSFANSKQDTLVSGTNIKTINNTNILGSGNLDIGDALIATYDVTPYADVVAAIDSNKTIIVDFPNNHNQFCVTYSTYGGTGQNVSLYAVYKINSNATVATITITSANAWSIAHTPLQDELVSGTNIKTVNGESIMGSGDVDLPVEDNVFIAVYGTTTFAELGSAISGGKTIVVKNVRNGNFLFDMLASVPAVGSIGCFLTGIVSSNSAVYEVEASVNLSNEWSSTMTEIVIPATETDYGVVKLNPDESVTRNSKGQLVIGGRLGAFSGTTGIFHSKDRAPRNVANYSLLITDALGIQMDANRSFAVVSGVGIQVSGAHAAGVTEYKVANTYANRILCSAAKYLSLDEATSTVQQIEPVVSVTINGSTFTPDSSTNDTSKPIIIKVANSINPNSTIASGGFIRAFGSIGGYASAYIGSCVGAATGGANFMLGQGVWSQSGNMNVVFGMYHYNAGNGNMVVGRHHISRKNRWFMAGTGHDNTSGKSEAGAAVGQYSDITSETLFAVGDGTSHTERSNAFEVRDQAFVVKSPDGTKWKVTVDNSGNLVTSAV